MYLKFYNLTKQPFHITPDPQFLYLSESHKQALAAMTYGIDNRKGFVAITGDVGVGKTTIVRAYLQRATTAHLKVIYLFYPDVTFQGLVKTIYQELGLDLTTNNPVDMVKGLGLALIDLYRRGEKVVIVIDEAQNMPIETLENLCILSNLETDAENLIQVVLAGQTELIELLEKRELRQLNQKIGIRSHIAPLTPQDSLAYIKHRLALAGLSGDFIFERKAIDIITKRAKGVPRMLNILCDNALITGFGYEKNPITASIAREIVSDFASPGKLPRVRKEGTVPFISSKEKSDGQVDHRPVNAGLRRAQSLLASILGKFHRSTGGLLSSSNVMRDRTLSGTKIQEMDAVDKEEPITAAREPSDGRKYVRREIPMSSEFIGDLSEIRLFDLVRPLVDGKKSGMVVIEGAEVQELYVEGGSIVHVKMGPLVGEEALVTVMGLDEGRVTFNWRLSPEKQTVRMPTEELMSNWAHWEEEWKKIRREVVGSSDTAFSIVVDSGEKDRIVLEKQQWGVLALSNGTRSVYEVARILGRSVVEVSKTISDMVGMGVLEKAGSVAAPKPRIKAMADGEFLATVETELKKVVGPVARVIMNDTLAAFDESRDAFPKERVGAFVQTLGEQIVEEQKRDAFEKAIQIALIGNV